MFKQRSTSWGAEGLIFTGLAVILVACSSGAGDTGSGSSGTPTSFTTINSFNVIGTSAPAAGTTAQPIDPNVNNGDFAVNWNVSSSDPYTVILWLSLNSTLETSNDIIFFGQNCGSSGIYDCNQTGSFSCTFTNANMISCGDGLPPNSPVDLTSFLPAIPQQAYIILKSCNGLLNSCKTQAREVVFN